MRQTYIKFKISLNSIRKMNWGFYFLFQQALELNFRLEYPHCSILFFSCTNEIDETFSLQKVFFTPLHYWFVSRETEKKSTTIEIIGY